jgi:hypothetical protein
LGEPFSDYDRILAAKSDDGRELPFWYPSRQIDSPDVVLPEDHRRHGPQPLAGDTFGLWFIGQAPLGWQASRMFFYAGTLQKARAAQDRLKAQWQHDSPAHPTIWTPGLPPAQK